MTLNEKEFEKIYNETHKEQDTSEIIRDKKNYNYIMAFLTEVSMFGLYLSGLKIQKHIKEQVLNNSETLNKIVRLDKTWERINLNLDLNFNSVVRDNILQEVDKSLNDVAKDFNEVSNHEYENKEEILTALSKATNYLNELKDRLQRMVVD